MSGATKKTKMSGGSGGKHGSISSGRGGEFYGGGGYHGSGYIGGGHSHEKTVQAVKIPKLKISIVKKRMPQSPKRAELQAELKAIYVDKKYTQYEYDCNYTNGYRARTEYESQVVIDTRDLKVDLARMIKEYIPSPFYYVSLGLVYGALLTVLFAKFYGYILF